MCLFRNYLFSMPRQESNITKPAGHQSFFTKKYLQMTTHLPKITDSENNLTRNQPLSVRQLRSKLRQPANRMYFHFIYNKTANHNFAISNFT